MLKTLTPTETEQLRRDLNRIEHMTKSPYFSAEEAKTQLTVLNIYYRPEFIQYPSDIAKQCEWIRELLNRCLTGANRIDPYGEAEVITKTLLNDLLLCRR